jgi:hypothetical protein
MRDSQVRRAVLLGLFVSLFSALSVGTAAGAGGVWPLTPRPPVVRGFKLPPKPWLPGHRGVDLLGSVGQSVRAASAGTVMYAGPLAGRGVVVISHGTTRTTYEPVVPSVHVGDSVRPGDPIGSLSAAPSHCAPRVCLHWGLLRGPTYLNPLSLLSSAAVRLLPTDRQALPPATADYASPPSAADRATAAPAAGDAARSASGAVGDRTLGPPGGGVEAAAGSQGGGTAAGGNPADRNPADGNAGVDGERAGSSGAGGVFVGVAALITIAGALLIRRH